MIIPLRIPIWISVNWNFNTDVKKIKEYNFLYFLFLTIFLFQVLNEAKGRILDDDTVISSLETLKREAAEVSKKAEETESIMAEIETTSQQYMPLATACSSIYFTIDNLHQVCNLTSHWISKLTFYYYKVNNLPW